MVQDYDCTCCDRYVDGSDRICKSGTEPWYQTSKQAMDSLPCRKMHSKAFLGTVQDTHHVDVPVIQWTEGTRAGGSYSGGTARVQLVQSIST